MVKFPNLEDKKSSVSGLSTTTSLTNIGAFVNIPTGTISGGYSYTQEVRVVTSHEGVQDCNNSN